MARKKNEKNKMEDENKIISAESPSDEELAALSAGLPESDEPESDEPESDEPESDEPESDEPIGNFILGEDDANGVRFNGDTSVRWKFNPEDVVILGIDDNCEDDDPLADDDIKNKLDEAQVKSVARDGVIQDILICAKVLGGVLRPVVVDGRHRTRWARAANQRGIAKSKVFIHARCVSSKVSDEALRVGKHTLNYVRAARNITSQAKAAKELSDAGRKTVDIAIDMGVSTSTVENFLALANASKPLLDAMNKGMLPVTGAYKLAKLSEEKQVEAVKETLALAKENKTRVKVSDAATSKKKVKGDKSASTRPGIGMVRKLLDSAKEDEDILKALSSCEPVDFLRWLLGDVSERALPAALRAIVKVKKKKATGAE